MTEQRTFVITLGEAEFRFPEPALKVTRQLLSLQATITAADRPDAAIDAVLDLTFLALQPLNPDLTRETIEGLVKFRELPAIIRTLSEAAGLTKPGEATPGTP